MSGISGTLQSGGSALTDLFVDVSVPASFSELRLIIRGPNVASMTKANTVMNLRYYVDGDQTGSENLQASYQSFEIFPNPSLANSMKIRIFGLPDQKAIFMPTFVYGGAWIQARFIKSPAKPTITSISAGNGSITVQAFAAKSYVDAYEVYDSSTNQLLGSSLSSTIVCTTGITNGVTKQVYVKAYNFLSGTPGITATGVVLAQTKAYSESSLTSSKVVPGVSLTGITYSSANTTTSTTTLKLTVTGTYVNNVDAFNSSTISLNLRKYNSSNVETLYAGYSNFTWAAISATQIELTITNLPVSTERYMPTFSVTNIGYVQPSMANLFYTVPSQPTVTVNTVGNGSVNLSFSGSTAYTIARYDVYDAVTNALLGSGNTISGLTNGVSRQVYVKAYNAAGYSIQSSNSVSFVPGRVLSSINKVSGTDTRLVIRVIGSFLDSVVKSQTGIVVRSFSPTRSADVTAEQGTLVLDNGSEFWQNYTITNVSATELQATVDGLSPSTDYMITFSLQHAGYIQPDVSSLYSTTAPPTVPSAPTSVIVEGGDEQAIVSFTASLSDGGAEITAYNVYDLATNTLLSYGTSSPITIVGLTNGRAYTIYVKAINSVGESTSSNNYSFTPLAPYIPCFLGSAPLLTPSGYKRIDSIKIGDVVLNDKGEKVYVKHVEVTMCPATKSSNPYVIEKGIFGATERVLISPEHRILVQEKMVKAKDIGLQRENLTGVLYYYNIELEGWSNMVVAGMTVESLAPIQRTYITVPQLVSILQTKYGSDITTAEITNKVLRTCRLMADGRVEVPILRLKA